jgi:hypothetical protein
MTRRLHEVRTPTTMACDGCGVMIPAGATAQFRSDGAVFHDTPCEAKHSDATPPLELLPKLQGSGL